MVFSSPIFLFFFLPAVVTMHVILPRRVRNIFLLVASLYFYAWGESPAVLLLSMGLNAFLGWVIGRLRSRPGLARPILAAGVGLNLGILLLCKYTNFLVDNLNSVVAWFGGVPVELHDVHLPLGISFFTFQAMSYLVDTYRGEADPPRNPLNACMYIALFPQLVAGPIVRYRDMAAQLVQRHVDMGALAYGIRRFVIGLGKKVVLANTVGAVADRIFVLPHGELGVALSWLGAACYMLQIYFDFSGYSDMAIGLGRMFGFRFLENFDYPYIAASIRDFWRRWHISLSTWFRDYLYVPLGGNRGGRASTFRNLLIVFFLCGLWHGASWNFVVWGVLHGACLVAERTRPGLVLARLWRPLRHLYVLVFLLFSWLIFRMDTLGEAMSYMRAMVGLAPQPGLYPVGLYVTHELVVAFLAGVFFATPAARALGVRLDRYVDGLRGKAGVVGRPSLGAARALILLGVLILSLACVAGDSYNPFIYFRF